MEMKNVGRSNKMAAEIRGMFRQYTSFRTRLFVAVFAALALDTPGATDASAQGAVVARLDQAALSQDIQALLKEHGEGVVANLWVGGDSGNHWFELSSGQPAATASAIKTFYLSNCSRHSEGRSTVPSPEPTLS
jgi:hypothetical protein